MPATGLGGGPIAYTFTFPQANATWSDVALIYTDVSNTNNGSRSPVLYAALGTSSGSASNGVYWSRNPTASLTRHIRPRTGMP